MSGALAIRNTRRYQRVGTSTAARVLANKADEIPSLEDWDFGPAGAAGALNRALSDLGNGGELRLNASQYTLDAPILAENLRGFRLLGKPGQYGFSGTRLKGSHNGKAVLSLVGSLLCELHGVELEGDPGALPKTGLLLGRSSGNSASNHTFNQVKVQGSYSVAGLYNVASEENTFLNCYIVPDAAPIAGAYFSQGDTYGIGGLTGSSMECNTVLGGTWGSFDATAGSTGVFLDCGAATGHIHFHDTFMPKNGGDSWIKIRLGNTDGLNTEFPISFHNVTGEQGATQPATGLHFTSATSKQLMGFTAKNLRFQTPSTNLILCDGGGTVYLIGADISTPYRAAGTKPSVFHRLDVSQLSLLGESAITIANLYGSTLRSFVAPTITGVNQSNIIQSTAGGLQVTDDLLLATGKLLKIGGAKVVAPPQTGWVSQMTGGVDKATAYDTATVNLAQLAQRVNALHIALWYHGLIAA